MERLLWVVRIFLWVSLPLRLFIIGPFLIYVLVVSFTGSEKVGKEVGKTVSDRFGKVSSSFKYYRIGIDTSVIDHP